MGTRLEIVGQTSPTGGAAPVPFEGGATAETNNMSVVRGSVCPANGRLLCALSGSSISAVQPRSHAASGILLFTQCQSMCRCIEED